MTSSFVNDSIKDTTLELFNGGHSVVWRKRSIYRVFHDFRA